MTKLERRRRQVKAVAAAVFAALVVTSKALPRLSIDDQLSLYPWVMLLCAVALIAIQYGLLLCDTRALSRSQMTALRALVAFCAILMWPIAMLSIPLAHAGAPFVGLLIVVATTAAVAADTRRLLSATA